jgi:hypothetical protein
LEVRVLAQLKIIKGNQGERRRHITRVTSIGVSDSWRKKKDYLLNSKEKYCNQEDFNRSY